MRLNREANSTAFVVLMASANSKQPQLFKIENPLSLRLGNEFFRALPSVPGVYFFFGCDDELLYIGQSSDLKARLGSYRHVTPEKNAKRTLRLVHRIHRIEWKECATAEDAIELERVLLLEKRPPFNRAGVWQGDPWWLKIEASGSKLNLELVRKESGTGPHPPAFRYAYGSLVRCLYRAAWPSEPLSSYPFGFFDVRVPLSLTLSFPEVDDAVELITSFTKGDYAEVLTRLGSLPCGKLESEMQYWQEEIERVKRYAAKRKQHVSDGPHVLLSDNQ